MLLNIATSLARASFAFIRYRISALGMRRFAMESVGLVAIEEIIDTTAEHSEWVEQNQHKLLAGISLAYMAKNSLFSVLRTGQLKGLKTMCSKLSLQHAAGITTKLLRNVSVRASHTGFEIMEKGKLVLQVTSQGGKIAFQHNGSPAVAAVLAATFAGQVPTNRHEWAVTGNNVALQLADATYSLLEGELRDKLTSFPALDLLSVGKTVIRNFCTRYPAFSEEQAVSMLQNVLRVDDLKVGPYSLDGFTDYEGKNFIRINGAYFALIENGDVFVLEPAKPADGPTAPLKEGLERYLYLLESSLGKICADGGVSLVRVGETTRFISTPFTIGEDTLALVVDMENPVPYFVFSSSTYFDSAGENLEDEIGESEMEAFSKFISKLFKFESTIEKDEIEFVKMVEEAVPVFGGAYRSGLIYLDQGVLLDGMGKI